MAVPTFIGAKVLDLTGSAITTVTVDPSTPTYGVGIADGDFLLLTFNGGNTSAPSALSGWTEVYRASYSATRNAAIWYKMRVSGETSYTFTAGSSNGGQATLSWFRGVDPTLTGLVVGTAYTRGSAVATNTLPSVTTTLNESLVISVSMEATTLGTGAPTLSQGAFAFFADQTTNPQIHTTSVSTINMSVAGASGATTVTYTEAAGNGFGIQLAVPASTTTSANSVFPKATIANTGWTAVGGATVHDVLGDSSDSTYAETGDNPAGSVFTVSLNTLNTGTITVRTRNSASEATPTISREVALLQGTTVIATRTFNLGVTVSDHSFTLTPEEGALVTDRTALRVRITDTTLN